MVAAAVEVQQMFPTHTIAGTLIAGTEPHTGSYSGLSVPDPWGFNKCL